MNYLKGRGTFEEIGAITNALCYRTNDAINKRLFSSKNDDNNDENHGYIQKFECTWFH